MRSLSMLLLVAGVIYLAFSFSAPGLLPDFGMDPFVLAGGALAAGIVLLMIDENGRSRRKWKAGALK